VIIQIISLVNEKRFDVKIKQSLFVLLVGSAFFFFFSTSTAFAKSVTFHCIR
jgi:hypothetical protein